VQELQFKLLRTFYPGKSNASCFLCFFVWKNCAIFPYEKTKGAKEKVRIFLAWGKAEGGRRKAGREGQGQSIFVKKFV